MSTRLRLKILVSLLVTLMFCKQSLATHSMGADLTYECVGGNNYKIRVSFYRDCIGINAPGYVDVKVSSASCGQSFNKRLYPIPGTGVEISPLCPNALSTCRGGVFTGIQEWIYEGIVNLPMQCVDWTFSYDLCCRNAAINTITTPLTNTFYIYATLNNTVVTCNTSPVFSNKPVPFACLGQQLCFNHGAYDADGDSLVYSLITPMQDASTTVNYIPPFNATNPLTSSPPVSFNNTTGDICMTPTQLDVTVMAVLVQEYRNGMLIGSVERDIQVTVINCNNDLPTLTGINGTNQFSATICANEPFCFDIYSNDPDSGQTVTLSYDSSVTGATFTSAGSPHPTGTFCWTPDNSDISATPKCFTVKVTDDNCPWLGSQIYSYCLTVVGVNVDAGPDQYVTCSDLATITATASGGTGGPYTYQWSNGFTNPTQTVAPGTYIVTVSDGMCSATDTVEVHYISFPTAAFTYTNACPNSPVQFQDQSTVSGSTIIGWYWDFGDSTTSFDQNPIHTFPGQGTYNVTLVVETNLGCLDTIMQPVTISPLPEPLFTVQPGCAGNVVTINNTTPGTISSWDWNFGNGQTSTQQNPTVSYSDSGNYVITLTVTDANGCVGVYTDTVEIEPSPVAAFNLNGMAACVGSTFTLNNTSGGNIISYFWDFGNGVTSTAMDTSITYNSSGIYAVTLTVTSTNGCTSTISQNISISPPPVADAGANTSLCLGQSVVLTATGGQTYQWSNGQTTNPITVSPATSGVYTVTVTDASGCSATDTVMVNVNPLPVAVISPNQMICQGQSATLTASGGTSYSWSPTGNSTSTITVNPTSTTTYSVTVTDANGCSAVTSSVVTVNPNPVLNIPATFVCPGTFTTLDAGNIGSTYQWSTGAITQSIDVTTPGNYTVTVTNAYGCTASQTVQVTPGDTITNTNTNVELCQGQTTVLDAGNPGNTYLWSTGATTQTILAAAAGQYTVTITNIHGCTAALVTNVIVNPLPQAAFTPQDICINHSAGFIDASSISSGNITSWQWNFGDGNTSLQQNPSHNFAAPGTYQISLVATSAAGCSDSVAQAITVYPLPVVNFTAANACAGSAIAFTNTSTVNAGAISSYTWNFDDGDTSSLTSPTHSYSLDGNYTVTLIANSSGGCVDSIRKPVTVYPLPVADFAVQPVCLGQQTSFSDLSAVSGNNINSWNWNFGNATSSNAQNPTMQYAQSGNYVAQLIIQTAYGCSDTIQKPVTVYALPVADAGINQNTCLGEPVTLTATGGNQYQWSPVSGNSSSITFTPQSSVTCYVTVTDTNNCVAHDSVRVNVLPLPVADAGSNQTICQGSNVSLQASGGVSYVWSPGSQTTASITVSPAISTWYFVTVTGANGCTATDSVLVTVNPLPIVQSTPDISICSGMTVALQASGGSNYTWYPTGDTTAIIYVTPQTNTQYLVEVTDLNGCKSNDTIMVNVMPSPVVSLSNTFVCMGYSATLDAGYPGSTYQWTPYGEVTQSIQVSTAGTYGVIVTTANGCTGYGEATVTVGGDSIVNNSTNVMLCDGQSTVLDAGNPGSSFLWSNGATSQTITVSAQGTYSVTITDANGCTGLFESVVTVNPLPVPQFTVSPICFGDTTHFLNQSTIASGNMMSYLWNFGDSAISGQQSPSHIYAQPGNYTVSLQIVSGNGCTASISQPVEIYTPPTAYFTADDVCRKKQTSFHDMSTINNGLIVSWNWDFGDGATSTSKNPLHTYANDGIYPVQLRIMSNHGCTDLYRDSVEIYRLPEPQIYTMNNCENVSISMTDISPSAAMNDIWLWSFGDGYYSNQSSPAHAYTTAGTYWISLTVQDTNGCVSRDSAQVEVYPNPVASFTGGPGCEGAPVQFQNYSTIPSGVITGYSWNFGDSASSQAENPSHTYSPAGNYLVTLTAISDQGCIDSIQGFVTIHANPVAQFQQSSHAGCGPLPVQFYDYSQGADGNIVQWNWNFGDGNGDTLQNPVNIYSQTGVYNVVLTVTSEYGCVNTDTVENAVTVYPSPIAAFTPDPRETNILNPVINFVNQSVGANTWDWTFGDGHTSFEFSPQHAYGDTGWYDVSLIVVNSFGCRDSAYDKVYIAPITTFFIPNAFTPNNDGHNEEFDIKGINIINYTLMIHDRWGELIYEGENHGWDGRVKGKSVQAKQDVYVYTVVAKDVFGKMHKMVGHVTLVR